MSNIINTLGAGSGIDTTSLVSQLVEIERAPQQNRLDTRQEKLEAQISAYGTLKSALSEFKSLLSPLANNDTFNARSVAFPSTDLITPNKLNAGAQSGTYQIEVASVARAHSLAMGTTADKKAALGATGQLSIQFGQWAYNGSNQPDSFSVNDKRATLNIAVEASDSLETLASKINDTKSGIQASVLNVDGQFQLMLTAPSGANNALKITGSDPSLSAFEFNPASFAGVTETQQASDALIKLNGLSVARESNEITDVIAGFNFTLNKASVGEKLTFTIEADKSVAEQAIRDFVEGYNSFYKTAKNLIGFSKDEETNATIRGHLSTDGTAKALMGQLRSLLGSTVSGVESGFTALTNLGIRTELDGSLSIKETEFKAALDNNFDLVETLFARKMGSTNPYATVSAGTYAYKAVPGKYEVIITQDPAKGLITSNAVSAIDFDAATETFTTPLDAALGDYSFKINVDGVASDTIALTGTYATIEELRADLQSRINGDSKLQTAGVGVDVTYDNAADSFTFTSREYGASSKVSFTAAGANTGELGIAASLTGTAGKDVAGTINGVAGFGAGNILLPKINTDVYGLNLTIQPGATAQGAFEISFTNGFAGGMSKLVDEFLGNSGAIATREKNINTALGEIETDRKELDTRMEKYETRLTAQYLQMQRIISGLMSTGDSLNGIVDRLPFTAQRN